jgi:hypothetical protein
MREPQAPHHKTGESGQGQGEGTEPHSITSFILAIDSQHQPHNTVESILHIAPPDASDVKKIKNCHSNHDPNKPHNPTCTDPTITILGTLQHDELQCLKLHTKIPLKQSNTRAVGRGSAMQRRADQLPALLPDPGATRRKRQRPPGEITQSGASVHGRS